MWALQFHSPKCVRRAKFPSIKQRRKSADEAETSLLDFFTQTNGMSGSQEGVSIPVRREENCLTGRIKKDHFTTASGMGLPTC